MTAEIPGRRGIMQRTSCLILCLLVLASLCAGQAVTTYTIDTVAGGAVYDNLPATSTPLSSPIGLWLDRNGALWIADTGNLVIRRLDPATGILRVVVGGGTAVEDAVPVPGTSARLDRPSHLVGDAAGNLYFTDTGSHRVRKLTPDGQVATVVGTGRGGYSGDGGPARLAQLKSPTGLQLDAAGNLYIADLGNCRIRRVDPSGIISTFAGNGQCADSGDGGPALSAGLVGVAGGGFFPFGMNGLALDSKNNLYLASAQTIRRIDRVTGIITTVVGITGQFGCGTPIIDGTKATALALCAPVGLVFDPDDNLYFTQEFGLIKVTAATGLVTNLSALRGGGGIVRDSTGRILSASPSEGRVLQAGSTPNIFFLVAGTDDPFDGPARLAVLNLPTAVSADAQGNVYVAETNRGRVRRIEAATKQVTTVLGGGLTPRADGVSATAAALGGGFNSLHVDAQVNIFFDQGTSLWKADGRTGKLARVAGQDNQGGFSGDGGPALQALLGSVQGIVTDASGNVFIADRSNNRVRKVDATSGIISTVAGNGTAGNSGDGGPATAATITIGSGLVFDRQGQLLIPSALALRRVNFSSGLITTVQARKQPGDPLGNAGFFSGSVTVDKDNNIFAIPGCTPEGGLFIREIRASDSVLLTVAGTTEGFFGDGGPAALARLSMGCSGGVAADPFGNIYLSDQNNGRVRKLTPTVVLPEIAVSPATLFFTQAQGSTILTGQQLSITSGNSLPFNWTVEVSTSAGGAWLNVSRTSGSAPATVVVTVDSSRLGPGTYRGAITIKSTDTSNSPQTVDVVLTVTGAAGAVLGISQQFLSFQGVQGGANPAPQPVTISNTGSGTLSWSASAETSNGGPWLKISPTLGTAPSVLNISADITGLAQGVYQGRVIVRNLTGTEGLSISVVLLVTRTQPILLPTQTGFLFVGVEGSLVIGPQSFAIQNAGQGNMDWQIQVNLPGGGDWLRVSPLSGSSQAGQPAPSVTLLADPSKLRAGISVALLTITSTGASNSPQTGIVLVNMLPRGSPPVGTINPLGLIFTAASGSTTTLTQGLSIASTGGQALQFLARARAQTGNWLSVTPEQGVLLSSAETANLSVQSNPTGLAAGVYFGSLTLSFGTGVTQEVAVALVVAPGATTAASVGAGLAPPTRAAACTPRRLVIVEKKLGNRFAVQVGWPVPLLVEAVDDCGASVTTATVTASFTGGEPSVVFQNLRDGKYSATWVPSTQGSVGVTIRAVATGLEDGVTQFAGTLGAGSLLPLLFRDGWVNAASFERFKPLAPGMIFSLFGSNLAETKSQASQIPLPRELGKLKVTLGGVDVPLFYADTGQVNAQVPYELAASRTASLVATGRGAAGAPGTVTLVEAQPGVFTVSQSGTGQGVVLDAQFKLVDANNPVKAGDVVQIYATGLGLTQPAVATGAAAPSATLANVTVPVKVTVGGLDAAVEFAGLAPGFVGLYQVNARVPAAVTAGSSVPLVLSQNGVASNTVTIGVR